MKFTKWIALLLVCTLAFSLTGCDALDYREAVRLYNAGKYDAAAEMFALLGEYENSNQMIDPCNYHAAIALMEAGEYSQALPRFLKLGDYEDSPQRLTECRYQLGVAAFEEGNLTEARHFFRDTADYKLTSEYTRCFHWQDLYDALAAQAPLRLEQDARVFTLYTLGADQICLEVQSEKEMGYAFFDHLAITLTRDSTVATFTAASSFTMQLADMTIGSTQSGQGKLDITTCTPDTRLTMETFEKTVTDNQGNTTTSTDPQDSRMADTMAENLGLLLQVSQELLAEAGIPQTLHDIGFYGL